MQTSRLLPVFRRTATTSYNFMLKSASPQRQHSTTILRNSAIGDNCYVINQRCNINNTQCQGVGTFSSAAAAATTTSSEAYIRQQLERHNVECDIVREAIKRMTTEKLRSTLKAKITDDELDDEIQIFQNLVEEAHACIQDCKEASVSRDADKTAIEEELDSANVAVEKAFTSYVDLLDDFRRRANEEQLTRWSDVRLKGVHNLKLLRQELSVLPTYFYT